MKILFATDGSEAAHGALQFLLRLPLPPGSAVQVLTVTSDLEWQVPPWVKAAEWEWAKKIGSKATEALEREGLSVTAETRNGAPAREILRAAEEFHADLLVLGSEGLTGVAGFLLGSVSQNVARHAGRPVLVARAPRSHLRRILLAVDESQHAEKAAAFAAALPLPPETEIVITSVARPYHPYLGMVPAEPAYLEQVREEMGAARRAAAERRVAEVAAQLLVTGRLVISEVREGNPAEEILRLAAEYEADLIVAGARGVSLIQGLIVGSVADRLLKAAACSVLLVHSPHATEPIEVTDAAPAQPATPLLAPIG